MYVLCALMAPGLLLAAGVATRAMVLPHTWQAALVLTAGAVTAAAMVVVAVAGGRTRLGLAQRLSRQRTFSVEYAELGAEHDRRLAALREAHTRAQRRLDASLSARGVPDRERRAQVRALRRAHDVEAGELINRQIAERERFCSRP